METASESDQLPEEGSAGQGPDDDREADAKERHESPGVPGEEDTATGNPRAAGAEDPDGPEDQT